jgi:acetoin utilization protein AcuC
MASAPSEAALNETSAYHVRVLKIDQTWVARPLMVLLMKPSHGFKMERKVAFLSSPRSWQRGHGPDHPLKPERLKRTHVLLDEYGAFDAGNVLVHEPQPASEDDLALFHTKEYIHAVKNLSDGNLNLPIGRYGFGPGDNPVFPGMYDLARMSVGSALLGAKMLAENNCEVAFSYVGGLHHGGPDFASGFCIFNDVVVAIQWLVEQDLRVAYIDIDVHHGDGVQAAFYETDKVLTISLHQDGRSLFPGTGFIDEVGKGDGEGFSVNVPLPPFTDDEAYLHAFEAIVPVLINQFSPDIVVTQLGVDTHYKDPLAQMILTTSGHEALFNRLNQLCPRWLALGGGGYAIDVVPRSWSLAFGVMSGQVFPERLPPQYRDQYGGIWLRDREDPQVGDQTRDTVQERIEDVLRRVKGVHGLNV